MAHNCINESHITTDSINKHPNKHPFMPAASFLQSLLHGHNHQGHEDASNTALPPHLVQMLNIIDSLEKNVNHDTHNDTQNDTFMLLSKLRTLNRKASNATRDAKQRESTATADTERADLELQNVLSERAHVRKEIERCNEHETLYQQVPLVPIQELPTSIGSIQDPHELMIARLNHELQCRNETTAKQRLLESRKRELMRENDRKKKELDELDEKVNRILKEVEGIPGLFGTIGQEFMKERNAHETVLEDHQRARSELPEPLYRLYWLIVAFSEWHSDNKITASIVSTPTPSTTAALSSSVALKEPVPEDTQDNEEPTRHNSDPMGQEEWVPHPKTISMRIQVPAPSEFQFYYFPKYDLVTVKSFVASVFNDEQETETDFLKGLFDEDDTNDLVGVGSSPDPSVYGYEHYILQTLCKTRLSNIPPPPPATSHNELQPTTIHPTFYHFMQRLLLRLRGTNALAHILPQLESGELCAGDIKVLVSDWQKVSMDADTEVGERDQGERLKDTRYYKCCLDGIWVEVGIPSLYPFSSPTVDVLVNANSDVSTSVEDTQRQAETETETQIQQQVNNTECLSKWVTDRFGKGAFDKAEMLAWMVVRVGDILRPRVDVDDVCDGEVVDEDGGMEVDQDLHSNQTPMEVE